MNVAMDKEQLKALMKEAIRELLAEAKYGFYEPGPAARQNPTWTSATRPRDTGSLMDRAEIFRMLD